MSNEEKIVIVVCRVKNIQKSICVEQDAESMKRSSSVIIWEYKISHVLQKIFQKSVQYIKNSTIHFHVK